MLQYSFRQSLTPATYWVFLVVVSLFLFGGCASKDAQQNVSLPIAQKGGESGMLLESSSFQNNSEIPSEFTCDGKDISPALQIQEVPASAKSLALIVDDPDAPRGTWTHWVAWNIDPQTKEVAANTKFTHEGINDSNTSGYSGPCPPSGTHRYFFKLYALDALLELPLSTRKPDLEKAMQGHILAESELVGKYARK